MKIKAYALINTEWKDWKWNNPFQQCPFEARGCPVVFPLAIFDNLKEARAFDKIGKRKEIKIKQVEIKIS